MAGPMAAGSGSKVSIGQMLGTKRWLLVATSMLLWWTIGQFDKINISLVIADKGFLDELQMDGRFGELGGLMSLFFVGYGVSIFFWGLLVDRFGARACLIAGTLGWAAVMVLMSRATSLQELYVARFLLGVAEGNMWPVSNSLTNRWFPSREHSRAQTFWLTGPSLGTALGVPLISALIVSSNWRGMILALAGISLIPLINFFFISSTPQDQKGLDSRELADIEADRKQERAVVKMTFGDLLRSGSFWIITLCTIISVTTIFTMIQWTPSFVLSQRGLTRGEMSTWLTIGYLLAVPLTVLVGIIADRTMKRALTAMATCLVFVIVVLPAAHWGPAALSAVLLAALTAVPCSIAALNGALLHTLVRPEAIARGTGIYMCVGSLVSAIGPWAFGKLIGALGGAYWGGFLFLLMMNVLGAICYFTLHRVAMRDRESALVAVQMSASGAD
ncbi:MAG: MFS transporter [Acidobacteria bacterium]|nr:MFS transporter [Acidobacteriota bacterium]